MRASGRNWPLRNLSIVRRSRSVAVPTSNGLVSPASGRFFTGVFDVDIGRIAENEGPSEFSLPRLLFRFNGFVSAIAARNNALSSSKFREFDLRFTIGPSRQIICK
tara:strand:- start:149 stop:466 length:318 start_codon:yes stop_codon:yes gene_type:complete